MFCPISGFPNYIINNEGLIYSQRGEMKHTFYDGYKRISLMNNGIRKHFKIHRLVFQHFGKDWNPELTVDHINGDRADNRIENLRLATQQQQNFNTKIYTNNKLGVKGVNIHYGKYGKSLLIKH